MVIWGLIGYRVVKSINPSQNNTVEQIAMISFEPEKIKKSETYAINANYRDPFLGALPSSKKVIFRPIQKKQVVFPPIQYIGFIAPKTTKKSNIYILLINNKQEFLKKRKSVQDVKLISGNDKEVVLKYKGETKTFQIQK